MRLRSSQFVFLLLLVCSLQQPESMGLRLASAPFSKRLQPASAACLDADTAARRLAVPGQQTWPAPTLGLTTAAAAAHRTPRAMQPSARCATEVFSYTGLRRLA